MIMKFLPTEQGKSFYFPISFVWGGYCGFGELMLKT